MTGLLSLVAKTIEDSHDVRTVTYIFIGVALGTAGLVAVLDFYLPFHGSKRRVIMFTMNLITCFGVFAALYSDMVLAAIANKWAGAPSGDNKALYWVYFAAKRLPTFSQ